VAELVLLKGDPLNPAEDVRSVLEVCAQLRGWVSDSPLRDRAVEVLFLEVKRRNVLSPQELTQVGQTLQMLVAGATCVVTCRHPGGNQDRRWRYPCSPETSARLVGTWFVRAAQKGICPKIV